MKYFFLFLLLTLYAKTNAQTPIDAFMGAISVKGGDKYIYNLQFSDSNGIVSGYSITDISGANETKTAITGNIDTIKKRLSFRETDIIYTKSASDSVDFCYVHAHLKISKHKGIISLKGHFEGYKQDGTTSCGKGEIMLLSAKELMDKLLEIAARDTDKSVQKTVDSIKQVISKPPIIEYEKAPEHVLKVTGGNTIVLSASAPDFTFEIWDDKDIDGDIVNVLHNGEPVLQNYTLLGSHKVLTMHKAMNGADTLRVIAVSEGSEPMNTARVRITSGDDVYYIDATTTLNHDALIVLKPE